MSKVGIVTFHRAENYGAILQCVALKEVIRKLGHDCEVIDYHNLAIENDYRLSWRVLLAGMRRKPLQSVLSTPLRFLYLAAMAKRKRNFSKDIESLCKPLPFDSIQPDNIVFGSDQIWNGKITQNDTYYLGKVHSDFKGGKIAYAASLGFGDEQFLLDNQSLLQKLNHIGVREQSLQPLLNKMNISATVTLDPTLLLNANSWDKLLSLESPTKPVKPYVLTYGIRNKTATEAAAKRLSKKLGIPLVKLCSRATFTQSEVFNLSGGYASVRNFVELLRNSAVVVTDSFHGTAFSLIYNKPLFSLKYNNVGDSRQESILTQVNRLDRFVTSDFAATEIPAAPEIERLLEELRGESMKFLRNALL